VRGPRDVTVEYIPTNTARAMAAARSTGLLADRIRDTAAIAARSTSEGPIGMMNRSARCAVMP
jgi:hypothetical protein